MRKAMRKKIGVHTDIQIMKKENKKMKKKEKERGGRERTRLLYRTSLAPYVIVRSRLYIVPVVVDSRIYMYSK